jgi:hypothetical protein
LIIIDGEEPHEFAIASADKKYAWADDPVNPNLHNKGWLPASPFEAE